MKFECILPALVATLAFTASVANALVIETVVVGDPGNAPDIDYHSDGGRGAVAYTYEIGKYQVTNSEYTEFLNAVATTDTHALYNTGMDHSVLGGITRSGVDGSYSYTLRPNMGNKPVSFVSFWDSARFTNWLHNGQPSGAQDNSSTEDGAYTLGGVTTPDNLSVFRNVGSNWFIPDENEWYKAAYYQPASQGGDLDDYWMFPTASNVQPVLATADEFGNISNPGPNVANYGKSTNWNGSINGNVTTVGSAGPLSESYYGTADQAGNRWDWYETIVLSSVNIPNQDGRGVWGGSAGHNPSNFRADHNVHHLLDETERISFGFRVARYAQETLFAADFDLDNDVDANDLNDPVLGWVARFGINLDGADFLAWQRGFDSTVGTSNSSLAVPEPSTISFAFSIMAIWGISGQTRVSRRRLGPDLRQTV